MADPTLEESLVDNIRDTIVIVEKLAPFCRTPDDLVGMLKLALTNEGQLQMLLHQLTPLHKRMMAS